MKVYGQLFGVWKKELNERWRNSKSKLKAEDRIHFYVWAGFSVFLIAAFSGLIIAASLYAWSWAMVFVVSIVVVLTALLLTYLIWDRPFQQKVKAYGNKLNQDIFKDVSREYGITHAAWELVLRSAKRDMDANRNRRGYFVQTALTIVVAVYVSAAASAMWNALSQMPSGTTSKITAWIYMGVLVIIIFIAMWMAGSVYDKFFSLKRRFDLGQFVEFVEQGLYRDFTKKFGGNCASDDVERIDYER